MPANWENSAVATGMERSVFIPIPKEGNAKQCSNYHTIALIPPDSKVMLKILQARLQQYVNRELPDVQAGFRKGRGARDQIANIRWIIEKALSEVAQSCPTLCDPMNRSMQASLSITNSRSSLRLMSIQSVMPSSHLILCHPLLLLPPIPPRITVFSNESTWVRLDFFKNRSGEIR